MEQNYAFGLGAVAPGQRLQQQTVLLNDLFVAEGAEAKGEAEAADEAPVPLQ